MAKTKTNTKNEVNPAADEEKAITNNTSEIDDILNLDETEETENTADDEKTITNKPDENDNILELGETKEPIKGEKISEVVEVTKPATDEEKILGGGDTVKTQIEINYESPKILYKVTNLAVNNTPITVTGDLIETFIGSNNKRVRQLLKQGAKKVISKDFDGKDNYKIEVVR